MGISPVCGEYAKRKDLAPAVILYRSEYAINDYGIIKIIFCINYTVMSPYITHLRLALERTLGM
jgi:hypothetical protein